MGAISLPAATLADVPALPTVDIPGVQLCMPGTWNGRKYTPAEFRQVAQNWAELRGQWDVPLTLGHDGESALGDGEPALGWVDNVRFDGEHLIGDYVKVPEKLAALIKSGALAKRSCTFLTNAVIAGQERSIVLKNVALLGAHQPAVDGLADVAALYNRRHRLAATGGTVISLQSEAKVADAVSTALLARLIGRGRLQLASGPSQDSIRAAVQAALNAAYKPAAPIEDGGTPATTTEPSSTICMLFGDSVVVDDNDDDAYFEIPFTINGSTAQLGTPVQVELRPTPIDGSAEPASPNPDASSSGDAGAGSGAADTGAGSDAAPAADGSDTEQMRRLAASLSGQMARLGLDLLSPALQLSAEPSGGLPRLAIDLSGRLAQLAAAQPADSAVEDLMSQAKDDFAKLLAGVSAIAAGKPGVAEFKALVASAMKALDRIKVAPPAKPDGGDAAPAKPAQAAAQNGRQEEPDVKLSALAKIYGLPETASEDDVMRAAQGAAASRDVVQQLARRMDERDARDAEREVEQLIDGAVSTGKLKRYSKPGEESAQVGFVRKLAKVDLKLAREHVATLNTFVDGNEYGRSGSDADAPDVPELREGVKRELRRLGRDPEAMNLEPLGARWEKQINERQKERAGKLGIPMRDSARMAS